MEQSLGGRYTANLSVGAIETEDYHNSQQERHIPMSVNCC